MAHPIWTDWYFGWGWVLWFGFLMLIFSGVGSWGYTYNVHQKYAGGLTKDALDILNERYARGDIARDEYSQLKADISRT